MECPNYETGTAVRPRLSSVPVVSFRAVRRIALVTIWVVLLATVSWSSLNYQFTPGRSAEPPRLWPIQSQLARTNGPALVIFLHPYCPCSRATLHELAKLLTHYPTGGDAFCVLCYPDLNGSSESDLAPLALTIPGLRVVAEELGSECALFGVRTSGTVLFYDAGGQLVFSGGITPSRGHQGANIGADSLLAAFNGSALTPKTPVFGCTLPSPASR